MRTTPAPASATTRAISGSAASAVMSLMIDGAGGERPAGDLGLGRVDRDRDRELGRERLDDRDAPGAALRSSETGSAPGRLDSPPRSSRSAPSATSRRRERDRVVGLGEPAAVGEAVRRQVDDPHHLGDRIVAGQDRPPTGFPARHDRRLTFARSGVSDASSRHAGRARKTAPRRLDHSRSSSLNQGCSIISTICLAMLWMTWL